MDGVTLLELSDGTVAKIDAADLVRVTGYSWHLPRCGAARYPQAIAGTGSVVFLHRLIAGAGPEDIVLHRNRDTLDNRRDNLVVMGRQTLTIALPVGSGDWLAAV